MASLAYEDIYSQFYLLAEAYDLVELSNSQTSSFLCGWLHSATSEPFVRRIFSSLLLDDDMEEMKFQLKFGSNDFSDIDLVTKVLSMGMVITWLSPKINSTLNTQQVYGSKEEKWFSQASHMATLQDIQNKLITKQRSLITDYNITNNNYLNGAN